MQIRVANRQDEPEIRTFVDSIYKESGSAIDIESVDSDLRNIEANYFGKQGLFIVAEDEGKIVGVAGARAKSESILEIRRLLVGSSLPGKEVLSDMLNVIVRFAPRMLYGQIDFGASASGRENLLEDLGFALANGGGNYLLKVTPDF